MRDGSDNDDMKKNHGMVYVLKLADNSLFVIDAGAFQYFNDAQVDKFMAFLREITGTTGTTDTIKIAAWFITHDHGDHSAGFSRVIGKYHEQLDFDRIFFNFPSKNINNDEIHDDNAYYRLVKYYANYLKDDDVKYMKIHTGQSFNLADIKIDVLYTHEDLVNPTTGATEITDHNDASSVIKITVDGETFMILGDIDEYAMNIILENNSDSVLKADAVQLAHHAMNDIRALYDKIQAEVLMVPQSQYYISINADRTSIMNTAKQYAREDMIFHQNEATFGIAVEDGQFVKVYEDDDVLEVLYDESWNWDIDLLDPTP